MGSLFHLKVRWGEDLIFNAPAGVGGKACPTVRVESIHCFHQADGADGNKVVLIAGQGVVFFYDVCHQTQIVPDQFFPCGRVTGTQCGKGFGFLPGREGPRKAAAFQMKRQNQKLCGKKIAEEIKTCRPLPIVS